MESKYPRDNLNKKNKKSLINNKSESKDGNTPLILAILSRDIDTFSELLSLGSSPNLANNNGETPLHISVINDNLEFLLILLKNNADCNMQNKYGNTPLHLAVQKKEKNMIEVLLKNGSNPNIKNNIGQTPTHLAIINKLDENILNNFKTNKGDIYYIRDNYNKTAFDYAKEKGDISYENNLIRIFGKSKEKNKYGQRLNKTKLSDIIKEIKNNSQNFDSKKLNDKYYVDTLLYNHSENNQSKYTYNNNIKDIPLSNNHCRFNTDINKKDIKFEDLKPLNNRKQNQIEKSKRIYTHGRAMICSDLNSNNIQIKELSNSSENENELNNSKKSLSDFLAEEINNLDINNYKENMDIVGINDNKNINISRIYSQKSENSVLSKVIENSENNNMNKNYPLSHSSSRNNTNRSDKSINKQNTLQSNSLTNKSIIKNVINDTVKKIVVKSISSSDADNISNLNILLKESDKNLKKNTEKELNKNTDNNYNFYENGTTSFAMYQNKNSNELNNILNDKENKSINISNINEEINLITQTNKTEKSNKTNEYIQNNNINRNKTIILPSFNFQNQKNIDKYTQESYLSKNNEIKDNIFLNSENSHIFSELNTNTHNNYNNVSLSYSKNQQSDSKNISNENRNDFDMKNSNNSLYGNKYSNNTRKKRISNGNPSNNNSSTGIKKSKSFIDSTMKKSNINKSIYNKCELEKLNQKNNDIESTNKKDKIENNMNNDRIYKKHHRQLSYHINYKSGLNNNKDKEFKRNNTKEIICNFNILQKSNKKEANDLIYQNKNNFAYYTSTKINNSENKNKNRVSKEPSVGINKSIKSLTSTNNPNITVTHNIFANSLRNSNNNNTDLNINEFINNKTKKINSNKISSRNTSHNTAFSTINKNNRQSKINNNKINIPTKKKNNNYNDEIIYNDYDGDDDEDNYKSDLNNINTDVLLRLREFLLSCDLLCYFNLMIEKNMYNIDSYINDLKGGLSPITYDMLEKIGIKKPGHIFRILIKLDIDSGVIDNNLFNFIIEKINYRSYTTTTLAMTSSINDINCCGINICTNDCKYGKRKTERNPNFNFTDLSSFLRIYNLSKFKGNFIFNGFDKIEFILIQMFSKYPFDKKILNNYMHIYINKDKIRILNKLCIIKSKIAKEFGIEIDYKEYNQIKGIIQEEKISEKSEENKKSIRKNMSYIKNINSSYLDSNNSRNDENIDNSNIQNQNQNFCNIF